MNPPGDRPAQRYDIGLARHKGSTHDKILDLVGSGRRVLELGCASGYMTQAFTQRGCTVVAVEIDADLAEKARPHSRRLIVGDLDQLDLSVELRGESFDVVVCADVLEHLADPLRTLVQVRSLLVPSGFVAASIPAITHVSVALELLRGNFDYRPTGLLDSTHRQFFSKRGLTHLFEKAGYYIVELDRVSAAPHRIEIAQPLTDFGPELVRFVNENDEAVTYQFVVKAAPASEAAALQRLRKEVDELRAASASLEAAVAEARERDLRKQLDDALEESRRLRERLSRPSPLRRAARRLWRLRSQTYRPRLTPLQQLRPISGAPGQWESLGDDPQFIVEPPLPTAWVEVRLRAAADPPTGAVLFVDHGTGFGESSAYRLGLLTKVPVDRRVYVPFGNPRAVRLDPASRACTLRIEELTIKPAGGLRVVARALGIYLGRQRLDPRYARRAVARAVEVVRKGGLRGLRRALGRQLQYQAGVASDAYAARLEQHRVGPEQVPKMREDAATFAFQPTFSVILPVYDSDPEWLRRCIESVRAQAYERWQLCIADDASRKPHVRRILEEYAAADSRIQVVYRERNGHIAAASNSALDIATGDFIALLDHDDELSLEALFEVAALLNQHHDADVIYSDEDFMDETGRYRDPFFKPDWSPELLLAHMYVGHLGVYRRSLVEDVGRFREGYEGSQDHDLCLRITERTSRVHHIPKVLYHWRAVPGSAAAASDAKPYATESGRRALEDALRRRRLAGRVELLKSQPGYYVAHLEPDTSQKITIVVPTRDAADILETCLRSVFELSTHPNFEVCVVDNGSKDRATFDLFDRWQQRQKGRFRVLPCDIPFNFPRLINAGAAATRGQLILMLNNDTQVLTRNWLEEMAGYAQRPEIAAVGCKLLYPDGTVQHGGALLLADGRAAHSHAGFPADSAGYFGRLLSTSNYAAVTGACLMVRRELFERLGGLDERLSVACNDIDFCLRAFAAGLRNVFLGHVALLHHESKTRGYEDTPEKQERYRTESQLMRDRWGSLLERDPYYNPNLRSRSADFSILH